MTTYNGALYLHEQLESIARQSIPPNELVIGDDCSTDDTVAIIKDFAKTAPFPVRLEVNPKNLGYGENFLNTATRCLSDWVAFCDQDDVWLEHKLALVQKAISDPGPSDLVLIVHQVDLVDEKLNPIGINLPWVTTKNYVSRRGNKCFWLVHGLAQVVRRDVFQDFDWVRRPHSQYNNAVPMSHDVWTSLIANSIGSTQFISKSCILYRCHAANLTHPLTVCLQKNPLKRVNQVLKNYETSYGAQAAYASVIQAYLEMISDTAPSEYRAKLREHAFDYRVYSEIMLRRQHIWKSNKILKRAQYFLKNISCSAYCNKNNFGSDFYSGVKDFAKVCSFI